MQIHRLFEIIYLLMERKSMTAKELSERFEVSVRTVYRDIDTLCEAGVPIVTAQGRGGGIGLMDGYVLNKSMLSEQEQSEILLALQSLSAVHRQEGESALPKLSALFQKTGENWIEVDFGDWGGERGQSSLFHTLKQAVIGRQLIAFDYYSSYGEKTSRRVEPVRLIFRGQAWYLLGYCLQKQSTRYFKLSRIKRMELTGETFARRAPEPQEHPPEKKWMEHSVRYKLKIHPHMAYRVYDEYDPEQVELQPDGSFVVSQRFPAGDWLIGCILSYGPYAQVLEPPELKREISSRLRETLAHYPPEMAGEEAKKEIGDKK